MKTKEQLNVLSGTVVDAAMEVHRILGPGLLERVYEAALARELALRGIPALRQVAVAAVCKGDLLDEEAYRIDLLVDDAIVVELKTVPSLQAIHEAQPHTYLRMSNKCLGFLINFNTILLRDGIKRRVFNFPE